MKPKAGSLSRIRPVPDSINFSFFTFNSITMKKSITALIYCSVLFGVHSADEKVREGVSAFYNYDTKNAAATLEDIRTTDPDHPGVHLVWAASRWLDAQYNNTTEFAYQTLEADLNDIIPVYESLMEGDPDNQEIRLYYGSALGLKARISLGKKEWINTLSNAYKGFRIIQEVSEKDSSLIDANLPIGIVEYYAGMSNALIQFAAGMFGLDASREAGLKKIKKAAEEGPWAWTEASSIISFIYLWSDRDPQEAKRFTEKLATAYPNNYYYRIIFTESLIRTGKLDDAKKSLHLLDVSIESLTDIQKGWFTGYLNFEWALYHFHSRNHDLAMRYADRAMQTYRAELDIILGEAILLKGKLLDLKGDREGAIRAYEQCMDLNNMSQAMQDAEGYLQEPFSDLK
jgi:hypothetical protein